MAKLELGLTPTSVVLRVKLLDSSVTTGAGLTGLAHDSAGLIIGTIAIDEATATAYTQAGATIETITTLGTYAAPTATKCRFKEVDATNHPGLYEIHIADARFATVDSLVVSLSGAADLADADFEISCKDLAMNTTGLAPASEYDTEMAHVDADITSRAPANEYDTQLDANISTRAPANEYDAPMGRIDQTISTTEGNIRGADSDTLETLSDQIDVEAPSGTGFVSWTYTVTDSVSGTPIDGVAVWVSSDLAGGTVIAGPLTTDASGIVTFTLNVGTVFLWRTHPGYNFTNPDQEKVVA